MSTQKTELVAVDVTIGEQASLHGPMADRVAERFIAGIVAAGGSATKRALTLADPDWSVASSGQWPPRGYQANETASYYVDPADRWVVSFVQGFGDEDVASAEAADAALWDVENQRPTWYVYDRHTGAMHAFTQRDGDEPASAFPRSSAILSGPQLAAVQAVIGLEVDVDSWVLDPATWQAHGYGDAAAYEDHVAALARAAQGLADAVAHTPS